MKKGLLAILLITIIVGTSFSQSKIKKSHFSLIIGSCFKSDTVDISINGQKLVRGALVDSNFSTGVTQLAIYQDDDGLWVLNENEKTNHGKLDVNKTLALNIKINGVATSKSVDLRKGWILMLDNCYTESKTGKPERTITIQQHKKTLVLE
ncbi:hypothetical protein C8N40_11719 [Pontibacter mucosus]|uniref:Uncharacterized protein n=1 Tax=Pontibacter mucosus TaxID=1649266 RepID=A0A2T5Y3F3_9BACT|nr:hypothetical protein [Pontibacter mucosus]PTX10518.1 hypothetical protein C8N40_11719 [Pontibacter mucosus]